jgi:predicted transcriptional regulator
MIERVESSAVSDLDKLEDLKNLFSILFFKDEPTSESIEEQIQRVTKVVNSDMKELKSAGMMKLRKRELIRARNSMMYFESKTNPSNIILKSLKYSNIPDAEYATEKIEEKLRKKMSKSIIKDAETYIPNVPIKSKKETEATARANNKDNARTQHAKLGLLGRARFRLSLVRVLVVVVCFLLPSYDGFSKIRRQ